MPVSAGIHVYSSLIWSLLEMIGDTSKFEYWYSPIFSTRLLRRIDAAEPLFADS